MNDCEFTEACWGLARHITKEYGEEVFRIGPQRFATLALMEAGLTPNQIARAFRLRAQTIKRYQAWIRKNIRLKEQS